jgi:hypothetical protein
MKFFAEVQGSSKVSPVVTSFNTVYLHSEPVLNGESYTYKELQMTVEEYSTFLESHVATCEVDNSFIQEFLSYSLSEAVILKKQEMSLICQSKVYEGVDVTLSDGSTKHFSFKEEDQVNLKALSDECRSGKTSNPYHADGELCAVYPSADIILIANTLTYNKVYHTTYCNHLFRAIESLTTIEDVKKVSYGNPLTGELLSNFNSVMSSFTEGSGSNVS